MNIPQSTKLTTGCLSRVFNNTVATYKYYWFISILKIHARQKDLHISIWDIIISMIANAWYPVKYFRLSFGKSDSISNAIMQLCGILDIGNESEREIEARLHRALHDDPRIKPLLRVFTMNVPFRFLSPWIKTSDDREMVRRSQTFENGCLYSLQRIEGEWYIDLNPAWDTYLTEHTAILTDFAYWNLTLFLQVRNPNVPNIASKLIRPEQRNALTRQRNFWNTVIEADGPMECIYTGKKLQVRTFDLDHFIPWSFVSHDLLWNLLPADPSINSSKSDKLPELDVYLAKLAKVQQKALQTYVRLGKSDNLLEDFLSMGCTAQELIEMDENHLIETYRKTFVPMEQIALNMGFEPWQYTL
ncbi:HNH endonuclease domain-containing protein [uncultured Bacteroides sp.]|uniref:HNH endonuclease domain-containing protein n=1 Tax=uncultured Bacteroides sp. TaxID=162156 RepID=UPI00261BC30B|nr:HNH endonuclease domain-containing protein [uncultured Bacteroides sp.]